MRSLLLLLVLAPLSAAQSFTRDATPFPVLEGGEAVDFPFAGGFFEPRPALVDIDADGDADLIVNVGGAGLQFFERVEDEYVWRTDRLGGIEPGNWATFGDLDGDGDLDLLARGAPGRVRYWRNTGTPQQAAFEVGAELLRDVDGEPVNIEDSSIPELADLDGDGDPDLFSGKADVGTITTYQHVGLRDGVPVFEFVTDEFQDIVIYEENPQCRSQGGAAPNLPSPNVPGRGSGKHGANAIAVADLDGNGAPELFWGDFFAPSLFYFDNVGTPTDPNLVLESERFPVGQPLTSGGYNAPTYGDVDSDGDLDLVVGVQRGLCFQTQTAVANLIGFENVGTPTEPDLRLETDRLLYALDYGTRSTVALADLDADGDLDMVLANESNPDDPTRANLALYENVGTVTEPSFVLEDADWLELAYDFGAYAPAFGDLDGDGDLDLLVGGFNGRFAFLRNVGTSSRPEYVREDDRWGGIDTGQYGRATLGDLDGDGDLDVIGGSSNGRVGVYRNVGTAREPAFTVASNGRPDSTDLAFRDQIGLPDEVDGDSAPALGDLDGDGDLDLLIGTARGEMRIFENTGTLTAPRFVEAEPIEAARRRTTPTLGNLEGDARPEIIAGTSSGGFLFWSSGMPTSRPAEPSGDVGLRVIPNPSTGAVSFESSARAGTVVVFDARGRQLASVALEDGRAQWSGLESVAGVYLAQLRTPSRVETVPFTRVR
ncbi:T9SS type A sorting domain-containing protein [Rubrivirga sp.]|uniref:T9SS type A sorting domain-containing protein n=1 Tax=Rubrivirga sp. TaxID=1885344 RepID=UPI003C71DAFC